MVTSGKCFWRGQVLIWCKRFLKTYWSRSVSWFQIVPRCIFEPRTHRRWHPARVTPRNTRHRDSQKEIQHHLIVTAVNISFLLFFLLDLNERESKQKKRKESNELARLPCSKRDRCRHFTKAEIQVWSARDFLPPSQSWIIIGWSSLSQRIHGYFCFT